MIEEINAEFDASEMNNLPCRNQLEEPIKWGKFQGFTYEKSRSMIVFEDL